MRSVGMFNFLQNEPKVKQNVWQNFDLLNKVYQALFNPLNTSVALI